MKEIASKIFSRIGKTARLLFLYDLIIYSVIGGWLAVLYTAIDRVDPVDSLIFTGVGFACIFLMRYFCKVYNQVWRYGGIQSFIRLLMADGIGFVFTYLVVRLLPIERHLFAVQVAVCCLNLLASLAIRMFYRYAYKCYRTDTWWGKIFNLLIRVFSLNEVELNEAVTRKKIRVAIFGAGATGVSLADELMGINSANYLPLFFIEIDKEKIGRTIKDIPVVSQREADNRFLTVNEIQEIIIALPEATAEEKKKLYELYTGYGCKVKSYDFPTVHHVGGKRSIRAFDVDELLFRKPLAVTNDDTSAYYKGKVVLITGGGGSIGSELCRQIAKTEPKTLIILDVYENGAYVVQQELRQVYGTALDLRIEILSVCDRPALEKVFACYRPNIVIHAAAHKHVPLMEHNCAEAVRNNVFGTLNTVELSEKYRVDRFMMVSTDKAVNPTNAMGATKRMCEMIVQCHCKISEYTTFSSTRFGNVLGSAGSVIPLFKKQIAAGGPVTLTDKRIVRYFMTIPEASQLVLQSCAMAKNGELFVLDMGNPVKILDLAENMIRLSGFEPYRDIDVIETGLRPGEKLYEELLVKTEQLSKTDNKMIFIERDEPISPEELEQKLSVLREAISDNDNDAARDALHRVVPTYRNPEEINKTAVHSNEMKLASKF